MRLWQRTEEGMSVIVIDHHKAGVVLPRAEAVVNQPD